MKRILKVICLLLMMVTLSNNAYADAYTNPNGKVDNNTTLAEAEAEKDKVKTTTTIVSNEDSGKVVNSTSEETDSVQGFQPVTEERPTVVENLDSSNNSYPIGGNSGERRPADERQFIMFQTKEGEEFYLIIDHSKTSNNVILLNQVTNEDLMALTNNNGGYYSSQSFIPQQQTSIEKVEKAEDEEEEVKKEKKGNPLFSYLIIIAVVSAFTVGLYKYKQISKQNKEDEEAIAKFNSDDEEDYEYDEVNENEKQQGNKEEHNIKGTEEDSEDDKDFTDDI